MPKYEKPDIPESDLMNTEGIEPEKPEQVIEPKEPDPGKGKPINLYRFFQLKPQKKGIEALLVSKFKMETWTMEQWETKLKDLLATKTK